jgi:hypothetical protein
VGLQVASLAILHELYGSEAFDKNFHNDEIAVGSWWDVQDSKNPIEMNHGGDSAETYIKKGKQALIGVRGYIGNIRGEHYLDSPSDRGENMVIISASQKAIDEIERLGSFRDGTHKMNVQIWAGLTAHRRSHDENRFLRDEGVAPTIDQTTAKLLLKNPIYTDIKVYVHPLGIMTLGEHLERLVGNNPRTPYNFRFYPDRHMSTLFERHKKSLVNACME